MPIPQGGGAPALPNFGGSLLFMCTSFDAELPNLTWQRMWKGGLFSGSVMPTLSGRGRSQRSPIFEVPFYLCVHPLSQNYQISGGNTYGEGSCF